MTSTTSAMAWLGIGVIHTGLDRRYAVILKTPNRYLQPEDIPPPHDRVLSKDVKYPDKDRYTLQWINPDVIEGMNLNNIDAAFKKRTKKAKPSELLFHYNYGAAAVKLWGAWYRGL